MGGCEMKRWILALLVMLAASPGWAKPSMVGPSNSSSAYSFTFKFDTTTEPTPLMGVKGSCTATFVRGGTDTITLYQTTASTATGGTQVGDTFAATTTTARTLALGQPSVYAVSDGASGGSTLTILCSPLSLGGGGGVLGSGPLADMLASSPRAGDLWQQTDDDGTGDCATGSGVSPALICQYDGSNWIPAGIAGGTDNLGNHTATTTLDLDSNPVENVDGLEIVGGDVTITPEAWTESVAGGATDARVTESIWSVVDGIKESGNKSTIGGRRKDSFFLTEAENNGEIWNTYCGADSDCLGLFQRVWSTGGSQTSGDEGVQSIRSSAYDSWGAARGTMTDPIAAGAATTAVTIDPATVAANEAKMLGENKLIIFTDDQTAVTYSTAPDGTYSDAGVLQGDSGTWASRTGSWTLGTGEGALVASTGYCFKADINDFTDWDGGTTSAWLPISGVTGDVVTTSFIMADVTTDVPFGYLADLTSGTGVVAPCGVLGRPTLNAAYAATGTSVTTGAGFPGVADNSAFQVHPYPGVYANLGVSSRIGSNFGGYPSIKHAFVGLNSMDVVAGTKVGRYQATSVLDVQYSGALSDMVDGNDHAFESGLRCGSGDCEYGVNYTYSEDTEEAGPNVFFQALAQLSFNGTDWTEAADEWSVIDVNRFSSGGIPWGLSGGLAAWDLALDKVAGWGQGTGSAFTPFMNLGYAQTVTANKTFTGTTDMTSGRIRVRDDATCTDNNLGGELCVTGPGALYVEGTLIGGGDGDITAVGGYASGDAFTDGTASTGNSVLTFEGTTVDASEFTIALSDDDPSADIAWYVPTDASTLLSFPSGIRTLATLDGTETFTAKTLTTPNLTGAIDWNDVAVDDDDCTGQQGEGWYDSTDSAFEFCNANSGAPSILGGAGSSIFSNLGTNYGTAEPLIIGGTGDDTAGAGEVGIAAGVVTADGFVARDQASGSNYQAFNDNPTTVPSAPSGADVRVYTTDDGEVYKKDADDSGDGNRLFTAQDFRRYPFFYTDFLAQNKTGDVDPVGVWDMTPIAAGTISGQAGTAHHPGWYNMLSVLNTANSGYAINSNTTGLTLAGGENYEAIFQIVPSSGATLTGAQIKMGFLDTTTVGAAVDGVYIQFNGSLTPACVAVTSTGGAATTTAFAAPVSAATWYRGEVRTNADASEVYCSIYTDGSDTPIETITIAVAADIPTGQTTGTGFIAYTTDGASAAHTVARIDWLSLYFTRRLNR